MSGHPWDTRKGMVTRGVGIYLKLGGQVVLWGAQTAPLVEIGNNWSNKTWVGNCPLCPPATYAPVKRIKILLERKVNCNAVTSTYFLWIPEYLNSRGISKYILPIEPNRVFYFNIVQYWNKLSIFKDEQSFLMLLNITIFYVFDTTIFK